MANVQKVRKSLQRVPIELDRERFIHFDLNAFAELEKRFGSVDAAMQSLTTGSMKNFKIVLWAGLIHDEVAEFDEDGEPVKYSITPYQVGQLIDPSNMESIGEKLAQAMGMSIPTDPKGRAEFEKTLDEKLKAAGIQIPEGVQLASIELTEEEKAEEAKNA